MSSEEKTANFFQSIGDFVAFSGGDHAIGKILVANNGIGATKAIRSIRRWSFETFGDERKVIDKIIWGRKSLNTESILVRSNLS